MTRPSRTKRWLNIDLLVRRRSRLKDVSLHVDARVVGSLSSLSEEEARRVERGVEDDKGLEVVTCCARLSMEPRKLLTSSKSTVAVVTSTSLREN